MESEEKINVEDLMVYDWCMIKDYPMKYLPERYTVNHINRSLCEYKPIELTPEILVNNEFNQTYFNGNKDMPTPNFERVIKNDEDVDILCAVWLDGSSSMIQIFYASSEEEPVKWDEYATFQVPLRECNMHIFQQSLRTLLLKDFANKLTYWKDDKRR